MALGLTGQMRPAGSVSAQEEPLAPSFAVHVPGLGAHSHFGVPVSTSSSPLENSRGFDQWGPFIPGFRSGEFPGAISPCIASRQEQHRENPPALLFGIDFPWPSVFHQARLSHVDANTGESTCSLEIR